MKEMRLNAVVVTYRSLEPPDLDPPIQKTIRFICPIKHVVISRMCVNVYERILIMEMMVSQQSFITQQPQQNEEQS